MLTKIPLNRMHQAMMQISGDQIITINDAAKLILKAIGCFQNSVSLTQLFEGMPNQLLSFQRFITTLSSYDEDRHEALELSFQIENKQPCTYLSYRVIPCYTDEVSSDIVLMLHDVSDLKNEANKLGYQAFHDLLTGCLNRRALDHNFKQATARQMRNKTHLSVMLIDLDNFKNINDSAGHDAGDFVLKMAVDRIESCLRKL